MLDTKKGEPTKRAHNFGLDPSESKGIQSMIPTTYPRWKEEDIHY
jgi:hypothetical protein